MTDRQRRLRGRVNETSKRATRIDPPISRALLIALLILSSCLIVVPQAKAAPPAVVTLPASNVTTTSAVLHATVNPNGLATTWDFSNPPTTNIYCPSPPGNLPADNLVHPVSCTATGLTPSTHYEYIVRATNGDGTSFGLAVGFTTAAPAATDWALSNPGLSPASPNAGDPVTFVVVLTALSTTQPYPQSVTIVARLDGFEIGGGTVTYLGPTGIPSQVQTTPPWTATLGTHTITWSVAAGVPDPNPSNNEVSRIFSVGPPPAQFDFEISASPTEQTATPGSSVSYAVAVNLLSGSANSVALSLSGEPAGVTKTFSPSSSNPTFSSSLTLSIPSSVSPGSYTMTITGTGGGKTHLATVKLTVSKAGDFRIDVSPTTQTVSQGQTVSYSVSVVGLNGFNSPVSLSVAGQPSGTNPGFSVASGTPDFSSTLTVTLPVSVQTGSFTLTITGSGGGLNRVATVVLVITTAPQTQTQTETATATPGLSEVLQQNSLLLIGLLVLIIVALLAAFLRMRKPAYQPPPPPPKPCPTCGKELTYVKQYERWYCNSCKEYK